VLNQQHLAENIFHQAHIVQRVASAGNRLGFVAHAGDKMLGLALERPPNWRNNLLTAALFAGVAAIDFDAATRLAVGRGWREELDPTFFKVEVSLLFPLVGTH